MIVGSTTDWCNPQRGVRICLGNLPMPTTPYSIVQRATSDKATNDNDTSSCVSKPDPWGVVQDILGRRRI